MRILWLFCITLILSACSVYKSAGRQAFEDRAPGQVQTNVGAQILCWTQPSTEPLWISAEQEQQDQHYKIRTLGAEEIEVCRDEETPPLS